MCEVTLI